MTVEMRKINVRTPEEKIPHRDLFLHLFSVDAVSNASAWLTMCGRIVTYLVNSDLQMRHDFGFPRSVFRRPRDEGSLARAVPCFKFLGEGQCTLPNRQLQIPPTPLPRTLVYVVLAYR